MNKANKELLKKNYEKACNDYVKALLQRWELDSYYGFWIDDEIGGLYDYGDGCFTINMCDIVYCVENDVKHDEYLEYLEYNVKCLDYNLHTMNLESWHMGAPRHDFSKLDALRKELNDEVDELNKWCKGGF